jgi:hypothetical protein
MEVNVLNKPAVDTETIDIQEKIKKLQQKTTFSFKLNGNELEDIQRKAAAKNIDWKSYLEQEIRVLVFGAPIGRPVINQPSYVSGGRVSAPVGGLVNRG